MLEVLDIMEGVMLEHQVSWKGTLRTRSSSILSPSAVKITEAPDFSGLDPETGKPWSPKKVVKILGLKKVSDPEKLLTICQGVVKKFPNQMQQYKNGKSKLIGFFIKKVMEETKSGAEPKLTKEILNRVLTQDKNGG